MESLSVGKKGKSQKKRAFQSLLILILIVFVLGVQSEGAVKAQQTITFSGTELLGRATDTSISIKIVPDSAIQYYYQYGTSPSSYTGQTSTISATAGAPSTAIISGLVPNTRYYYRMQYNYNDSGWVARSEYSFWTQRASGSSFTFDVTSDSHVNIMMGQVATWTQTLNNIAEDDPDFLIDLGDTIAMDSVTTLSAADANYLYQRDFFDIPGNSAGIYLSSGNHEQTEGWHRDDNASITLSPPVMSVNMQKKYYLNPVPDAFYSGNTETFDYIDGDHLLSDYYSWEWGDALFVVIDPYWYTMSKPFAGNTGGGEPETGTGNRWDWTLGLTQFTWLKQTLENSDASYKFIFTHHMVGGSDDYVRGGANPAHLVEWGGYNVAGSTYEWAAKRPGWGSDPVHNILVANHVSAFIHGHDHQYAYEKRDGVVYLSMPAAGFSGNGFNIYQTGNGYTIQALASPGHVRVHVTPSLATLDYISSSSGSVSYSFTIEPSEPPEQILGDANGDGSVNSTDALIILSGDVGISVSSYCPMNCGDVNGDTYVNSTDAVILLSHEIGITVPFNVGEPGCPLTIIQPPGCSQ